MTIEGGITVDALVGVSANLEILHAGVTLDGVEKLEPAETTTVIAGSSVNVALALAAYAWSSHVVAAVGKNGPGNTEIVEGLALHGIGSTLLPVRDATPIATVLLYANGGRHLVPSKPPVCYGAPVDVMRRVKDWGWSDRTLRIFTGVRPDEVPIIRELLAPGDEQRTVLSPNRKLIEEGLLAQIPARVMFLGTEEMRRFWEQAFGHKERVPLHAKALRTFFAAYPATDLVVLTKGKQGSIAVTRDDVVVRQDVIAVDGVRDTTGCGDVFLATVVAYLYDEEGTLHLDEPHLAHAMRAGAVAASLKLTRIGGSSVPTRAEVEAVLRA